jgi:hypothetical protein
LSFSCSSTYYPCNELIPEYIGLGLGLVGLIVTFIILCRIRTTMKMNEDLLTNTDWSIIYDLYLEFTLIDSRFL